MCTLMPIFIPMGGGSGAGGYVVPKRLVIFKVGKDYYKIKVRSFKREEAEAIVLNMIPKSTIVKTGIIRDDMLFAGMVALISCVFLFLAFLIAVMATPVLFNVGEPLYFDGFPETPLLRPLARVYLVLCIIITSVILIRAWRRDIRCP